MNTNVTGFDGRAEPVLHYKVSLNVSLQYLEKNVNKSDFLLLSCLTD